MVSVNADNADAREGPELERPSGCRSEVLTLLLTSMMAFLLENKLWIRVSSFSALAGVFSEGYRRYLALCLTSSVS